MRTAHTATLNVTTILHDTSVERDDEAFFDTDTDEIIEALTWFEEDEDEVMAFLGDLGFDVDDWTKDAQ